MNNLKDIAKRIPIRHNVSLNVIDLTTKKIVKSHTGHNASTNGLLTGIGHYLAGDGILNQGWHLLKQYVPQYISLGTMGLYGQEQDREGLPSNIGIGAGEDSERFKDYILQCPGFGADGYDKNLNNNRKYLGLGPQFNEREDTTTTANCELISSDYTRSEISFRDVVPEIESEFPKTIDVVFSAMVPLGTLKKFRPEGCDYIFITEAGLWSRKDWIDSGDNGLLAGYRICPPDEKNWDMSIAENRNLLKREILKVGKNQVVQIVWKIQLGGLEQLGGLNVLYPESIDNTLRWHRW